MAGSIDARSRAAHPDQSRVGTGEARKQRVGRVREVQDSATEVSVSVATPDARLSETNCLFGC
eukprot:16263-Eustigmatos_ZCMA.PRE.1